MKAWSAMNQLVVMPRAPMATWAALGRSGICDPIRGGKQRHWPAAGGARAGSSRNSLGSWPRIGEPVQARSGSRIPTRPPAWAGGRAASTPTRVAQDGLLADADLHVDRSGLLIGACAPYRQNVGHGNVGGWLSNFLLDEQEPVGWAMDVGRHDRSALSAQGTISSKDAPSRFIALHRPPCTGSRAAFAAPILAVTDPAMFGDTSG